VSYISEKELLSLPEDPEEAFIELEGIVRSRFQSDWDALPGDESVIPILRKYLNAVLPAVRHYGIELTSEWSPPLRPESEQRGFYATFMDEVDFCISELRLRIATRIRRHSVVLDEATKIKLRHLLNELLGTVDKLEIPVAKKDRLRSRILALQEEIERERTRFETVGTLFIEACGYGGEGAKGFEPVVRLVERIGAAVGLAKNTADAKLPPPPKRIESKPAPDKGKNRASRSGGGKGFDRPLDDEIPF
jgi:hypothetical protein